MFILQFTIPSDAPPTAPAGPPIAPAAQEEDPLQKALSTPEVYRTSSSSSTSGSQDGFTSKYQLLRELLRSGLNPDSDSVKIFLAENNLQNDPEIKKIFENHKKDKEKYRKLIKDGVDPKVIEALMQDSTLSDKEKARIEMECDATFGNVAKDLAITVLAPPWISIPRTYNKFEKANRAGVFGDAWRWLTQ